MTTLELNFPHKELTKLSTEDAPTAKSLLLLHKETYANARSVESDEGGGAHGHLGYVMPAAPYLALGGGAIAWVDPQNPGALQIAPGTTQVQVAIQREAHTHETIMYRTTAAVGSKLKSQLLEAVPNEFLNALEDPVHGFSETTAAEMLAHLTTAYGTVTPEDLEENEAELSTEWNPATPTEVVFDNANKIMVFATSAGEGIPQGKVVRTLLKVFEKSGVLGDAVKDWKKKPAVEQTPANMRIHFRTYNKRRLKDSTTAATQGFGTANAATGNEQSQALAILKQLIAQDTAGLPVTLQALLANNRGPPSNTSTPGAPGGHYYCWSHGLSTNRDHTSGTCSSPAEGHNASATLNDMKGGNPTIRRSRGERAIYRRPDRRPNQGPGEGPGR
jgi:hypothetical protein